jgi:hypothetical protein
MIININIIIFFELKFSKIILIFYKVSRVNLKNVSKYSITIINYLVSIKFKIFQDTSKNNAIFLLKNIGITHLTKRIV